MKDSENPWFEPLWRRVALTVFVGGWFAWELFFTRDSFWTLLTGAALAYAIWTFIIRWGKEK